MSPDPWPGFFALFHRHPGTRTEGTVLHAIWTAHLVSIWPQAPDFLPPEVERTLYSYRAFYQELAARGVKRLLQAPSAPVVFVNIRRKPTWPSC